jgi:hypothetical protein
MIRNQLSIAIYMLYPVRLWIPERVPHRLCWKPTSKFEHPSKCQPSKHANVYIDKCDCRPEFLQDFLLFPKGAINFGLSGFGKFKQEPVDCTRQLAVPKSLNLLCRSTSPSIWERMMTLAYRRCKQRHPVNHPTFFIQCDDNFPAAAGLSRKKGSKVHLYGKPAYAPYVCAYRRPPVL